VTVNSPELITDSGGIPEGLDPHKFYDDRSRRLMAEAVGAERLAYIIFGREWIKSFAFAVDPFSQFKLSFSRVSAVTRSRTISSGQQRVRKNHTRNVTISGTTPADLSTPNAFDRLSYREVTTYPVDTLTTLASQDNVKGVLNDTTSKTRDKGVRQGEAKFFVPEVHSPPRSRYWVASEVNVYNLAGGWQSHDRTAQIKQREGQGPAATISNINVQALATLEDGLADTAIAKYALGLLNQCRSQRRSYTLYRNAAELKDLPQTLKETTRALTSLYHTAERLARLRYPNVKLKGFHKRVANQYLNEKFGWEATLRDVLGLMESPARVARRVNYLMSRTGLDTTYRSSVKYTEPISSPPTFTYLPFDTESQDSIGTTGVRQVEVRCVVNCNVRLPDVEVPELRRELTRKFWGVDPSPVDVYNIVPWTWLYDWFTGFGDYVEAFENVNNDRNIINWGLITYLSRGEIQTNFAGKVTCSVRTTTQSVLTSSDTFPLASHTSQLNYRYRKRINVTESFHVKPTWNLPSFSGFQLAIIGALLTKFT
jgi:hypothetical protein